MGQACVEPLQRGTMLIPSPGCTMLVMAEKCPGCADRRGVIFRVGQFGNSSSAHGHARPLAIIVARKPL
ncbi:MAG: hypothetical protein ABSG16_15825 [Candidatus Acidiferrum sp.]